MSPASRAWFLLCALPFAGSEARCAQTDSAADLSRHEIMAWQIALEANCFSPGLVDGVAGPKTFLATRAFQASRGLPLTGQLSPETSKALGVDPANAVGEYRIAAEDERQVKYCPPDWNEKSRRSRLLYPSMSNCVAEKFHTSERCLALLNPGKSMAALKPGDVLRVPNLRQRATIEACDSIEIDLSRKLVLILDASGVVQGLLHCSVAKDLSVVGRGEARIATVVADPHYTFDPKKWPEVKNVRRTLLIPPGPRCPVGVRWMGLDRPGVGIHGTAEPENIGKTGSHGCFRLTNWDAVYLASTVSLGTKVSIVDRSSAADQIDEGARLEP